MAHSEFYPDGGEIKKFIDAKNQSELAKYFGKFSQIAFMNGAEKIEQRIIRGNEPCPKCNSGIRFDLCCGKNE